MDKPLSTITDGYQRYRTSTAFLLDLMTLVLRTKSILIYR
jgi:hypothetical protein